MIQTRIMLNMVSQQARSKIHRLINVEDIKDESILLDRTMESVNKGQVQTLINAANLDSEMVKIKVKEIIADELNKATAKRVKQNVNPKSPLNEYAKLKVALMSGRRNRNDFVNDTLKQLRIEAAHYKEKYGDKATDELIKEITKDKQYMEVLSVVKIGEPELRQEIEKIVGSGKTAEQVEREIAGIQT